MLAPFAKRFRKVSVTTGGDTVPASMNVIVEADQFTHFISVRPTRNGSDDFEGEMHALNGLHWISNGWNDCRVRVRERGYCGVISSS